ncbi:hypothetical protein ABEB36_014679 [Hypothenemus hampei]|uniref:Cytokine-inducible SH2-containing protein n=1 Tax=Hypothenemus hampei TaxID=57062 RepID=A0ABD1E2I1_HYPHA
MRGCSQSTVCPNCNHEFTCCNRKSLALNGGGLVKKDTPATNQPPPQSNPYPTSQVSLVSPSAPLFFGFPLPLQASTPPQAANQDVQFQQLKDTVQALRRSGWFYEDITFEESHELLKNTKVGTFLVRNSSNPKFLYSLSVQTEKGPTSVRLQYNNGYFKLDAQPHLQKIMPAFPNVISLIQYYVQEFERYSKKNMQVWVDDKGKWYSPIEIKQPLRKRDEPPRLKHLACIAIHKALNKSVKNTLLPLPHKQLELPQSLVAYLREYPHWI